jgi:hypothetical protein
VVNYKLFGRIKEEFFSRLETLDLAQDVKNWGALYEEGIMDPRFLSLCLDQYQPPPESYQSLSFFDNLNFQLELAHTHHWWPYDKFFERAHETQDGLLYIRLFKKLLPHREAERAFWEGLQAPPEKIYSAMLLLRSLTVPENLPYWLGLSFQDPAKEVTLLFDLLRQDGLEKHLPWLLEHKEHPEVQKALADLSRQGLVASGTLSMSDSREAYAGELSSEDGED